MYSDLTDDELQAWLLSESISDDAILAPESEWLAAQLFRIGVHSEHYLRVCLNEEDIEADIY